MHNHAQSPMAACANLIPKQSSACASSDETRDVKQMQTSFLQSRKLLTKRVPLPVSFLHVPKCGGNQFAASIITLPGVCTESEFEVASGDLANGTLLGDLDYNVSCSGLAEMGAFNIRFGSHEWGIDAVYALFYAGPPAHGFTVLRQPEQRMLSQYSMHLEYDDWDIPLEEFVRGREGCYVKMLTSSQLYEPCVVAYPSPSGDDVSLAVQRLRNGFSFVGIQEEYDLSVCLLHAMFGGECSAQELTVRNAGSSGSSTYDTSVLGNWTDVYDAVLYSEAVDRFQQDLKAYGISETSCQACWSAAIEDR